MINIVKHPYPCSFTRNEVLFQVTSNMQYPSQFVYPGITFTVNSFPTQGIFMEFEFQNPETREIQHVRLLASTVENVVGVIPAIGGLIPIDNPGYATYMAQVLRSIPEFNAFYNVVAVGSQVICTGIEAIEELVPKNLQTNQVASTYFTIEIQDAFNLPEEREGYEIRAQVYFEGVYKSGDYEMVADLLCVLNENGVAAIDVADILNSETEASWNEIPVPRDLIRMSDNLRNYYVEFVETWDSNPVGNKTVSPNLKCHWGGVSRNDELMQEPMSYIDGKSPRPFLTWWPSGKQLYKEQRDWISWMNTGAFGTFTVRLRITKNSGVGTLNLSSINLLPYESLVIPTGYNQRNLDSLLGVGEVIAKWSITIMQGASPVSPEYFFYPENTYCIRNHVLYFNAFGMPETFMTSGNWQEKMNLSTELGERGKLFNRYRLRPGNFIFNSSHQNSVAATTCRLPKLTAYRLQVALSSIFVLVWDNAERWVPAVVTTDDALVEDKSEFTTEVKFELLMANRNDRASFMETAPVIVAVQDGSITSFTVQDNGIEITGFGNMTVTGDTSPQTIVWDSGLKAYVCAPALINEKTYTVDVVLTDSAGKTYTIKQFFAVEFDTIAWSTTQTGSYSFNLAGIATAEVTMNWGEGGNTEQKTYFVGSTAISKTLTVAGKKNITMRKASFKDITQFSATGKQLIGFEFNKLPNLTTLGVYSAGLTGTLYLNACTKLESVDIRAMALQDIEFGITPNLAFIILQDLTSFNQVSLDNIITQIWNYRDHYNTAIALFISGTGLTFSAEAQAKIDGTGIYTGEGLVTDYGFTITLS